MPNNPPIDPSNPPDGTYNCTCGTDFSSWDGSFKYTKDNNKKGTIVYTLKGQTTPLPSTTNMDSGNAIKFELTNTNIPPNTVEFKGSTFKWKGPNNKGEYKAEYSGTCKGPGADPDGWTATQE
jgi:hypothetical protein